MFSAYCLYCFDFWKLSPSFSPIFSCQNWYFSFFWKPKCFIYCNTSTSDVIRFSGEPRTKRIWYCKKGNMLLLLFFFFLPGSGIRFWCWRRDKIKLQQADLVSFLNRVNQLSIDIRWQMFMIVLSHCPWNCYDCLHAFYMNFIVSQNYYLLQVSRG